jgi:hypothetical protein
VLLPSGVKRDAVLMYLYLAAESVVVPSESIPKCEHVPVPRAVFHMHVDNVRSEVY